MDIVPPPLQQDDPEVQDHCRRVGGIAALVAHQLFLPTRDKHVLQTACLMHHQDPAAVAVHDPPESERTQRVLESYAQLGHGSLEERQLASILRLADAFDRAVQAEPMRRIDSANILAGLRPGIGQGLWSRQTLEALQNCTQPLRLSPSQWHVPVFPQASVRTLQVMRNPSVSIPQVVDAARRDPATAGCIMRLANSALYFDRGEVSTLAMAVARLGFETACKVVATLAMRPLLFLPRLEGLWPHSIEVADLAEQLAVRTGRVDPGEAYLAGLLHDIGRIALTATSLYDAARLQGLEDAGCPAVYAEDLILRINHAGLGAQIARAWTLPERLIASIELHHRPEAATGPLPCLLYLAEHISGSPEDLPSAARLKLALAKTGLVEEDLGTCVCSGVGSWLAAA